MIPTGVERLDKFLSGGVPPGVLVDIFGANGTGKTLLLLHLLVGAIGATGRKVLYLDTTGGFRPERVLELTGGRDLGEDPLGKIMVSRITNTFEQQRSVRTALREDFALIAVDNVTDLFSYEYPGDEMMSEKNSLFMQHMRELSGLAVRKGIPVAVTNMIRNVGEQEIENMDGAIDPFTHIKIHLRRDPAAAGTPPGESPPKRFSGRAYWALKSGTFTYVIGRKGLSGNTEDF